MTVDDGYPLTVGRICNVTGTVVSFVLKQTRILSRNIPCECCAGAIKNVCATGSHHPPTGTVIPEVVDCTRVSVTEVL